MLQIETNTELEVRVKAINLTKRQIARRAGVAFTTAYRGPKRISTHNKIVQALVEEELRVLQHLLKLHGCRLIDPLPLAQPGQRTGEAA